MLQFAPDYLKLGKLETTYSAIDLETESTRMVTELHNCTDDLLARCAYCSLGIVPNWKEVILVCTGE